MTINRSQSTKISFSGDNLSITPDGTGLIALASDTVTVAQDIALTGELSTRFRFTTGTITANIGGTSMWRTNASGLQLLQDMDVNDQAITTTVSNGNIVLTVSGTGRVRLNTAHTSGQALDVISTLAGGTVGPTVKLYRNATGDNNDNGGMIQFVLDDAADTQFIGGQILATMDDASDGAWLTSLKLQVPASAGATSPTTMLTLDATTVTAAIPVKLPSYAVSALPSASAVGAGAMAYCTDDGGGAVPVFSDGSNWLLVTDRTAAAT